MTTRVDIEELQTTKTEKLLAVVLAIFILIGGVWAISEIDDWVKSDEASAFFEPTPASSPEIDRRNRAQRRVEAAAARERRALEDLELKREAYRTALDADEPAERLKGAYATAEREYARAREERAAAGRELSEARPAAVAAERRFFEKAEEDRRREERKAFAARLAFVLAAIFVAYLLLWHLHGRQSPYLALAFAGVVSATLLAVGMAGDYLTDYFDPLDLGPLILSLVGSALTVAAFYLLQRYLARRLPARRVRKRHCPFCGYRAGDGPHCEGCGRDLVAPCAKCSADRVVGTLHCRACGAM